MAGVSHGDGACGSRLAVGGVDRSRDDTGAGGRMRGADSTDSRADERRGSKDGQGGRRTPWHPRCLVHQSIPVDAW